VHRTVAGCFAVLRQNRSIRRSLTPTAQQTLVVSLGLSRLDYGNAVLVGVIVDEGLKWTLQIEAVTKNYINTLVFFMNLELNSPYGVDEVCIRLSVYFIWNRNTRQFLPNSS
jgi:hypothetical protein